MLGTTERAIGTVIYCSLEQVLALIDAVAVKACEERMGSIVQPLIPMLVHEVIYNESLCFGKVGIYVRCRGLDFDTLDKYYLCLIGREEETFYVCSIVCQLLAACAVGVYLPQLAAASLVREECYLAAAFYPCGAALVCRCCGKQALVAAVSIHPV